MDDLFDAPLPGPKLGRNHPETSAQAAEKIAPALPGIRERIIAEMRLAGAEGRTDDELAAALPDVLMNSLRPARVGLVDGAVLVDSGMRRRNGQDNECIVWLHSDFSAVQASPKPKKADSAELKAEGLAMAQKLATFAASLKREGRGPLSNELARAAEIMAALARL